MGVEPRSCGYNHRCRKNSA